MTHNNERAYEIFNAARELPSAEREPFLDRECGDDDDLRAEVESLLEHHFTSAQTVRPSEQSSDTTLDYQPGDMIGSFKILHVLGEGGMGIVYLAEQSKPVKRRVALKVIKAGMDTKQVIARFEAERQALAIMNHPGIAQVYEAGATEHGRPYFVMEHVKGMSITEACDEHKLNITQRLELMAKVCDAVQHAHSKMIIHRDLKPSNILVSLDDGTLEPKIIDFGVAKAMTYQLTEKTLVTQVGHFVGTPAYMSPEQADLKAIDIDAKTDVYALGVILYEVLTGMPPFDPQALRDAGLEKMREIIRTQPPPKPSTQLSSISDADDATKIAQARQTQISALAGLLRKELEWIPLKALKKQRSERYDSAKSMGDDIRSYLEGEPLKAGPDSASYRFKKTLRNHKGPFIAAAIVFLVLVGGIITTTTQAIRANKQAVIAEQEKTRAVSAADSEAHQRLVADKALEEAKAANVLAEQQRDYALKQEGIALQLNRKLQQLLYINNFKSAVGFFLENHYQTAIKRLLHAGTFLETLPLEYSFLNAAIENQDLNPHFSINTVAKSIQSMKLLNEDSLLICCNDDGVFVLDMLLENVMVSLPRHASENLARALIDLELSHHGITCPDTKQITSPDGSLSVYAGFNLTIESQYSPYYKTTAGHLLKAESVQNFYYDKTIKSISISNEAKHIAVGDSTGNIFILDVNNPSDYQEPEYTEIYTIRNLSRIRQSLISGQRIVLEGHSSAVNSIIFNSDGSRFISAGSDGTIRIWVVDSLTPLLVITVPNVEFVSVALDKDESFLVASDTSGKVYCWRNDSRNLANHNHKFLKRSYEKFSRLVEAWLNSSNGNFKDVIKKMKIELANYSQTDGVVIKNIILQKILEESSRANSE